MNAINAYNRLNANVAGLKKASEKLSSGYRINRAGDDAAGLAISEKMRSQIKGLNQAVRNSQDGINMIQTFEGAAQETHSILQRMKELATESANGTYDNATDRAAIQLEFDHLNDELNQIADTDFNGTIVLNGGEMADGLKASGINNGIGEFNYKTKAATEAAAAAEDAKLLASAQDVVGGDRFKSMSGSGTAEAAKTNVIDNSGYGKTDADAIWKKLGLDANEVEKVDVTFTFDGTNWVATAATNFKDSADNEVKGVTVAADALKSVATSKVNDANTPGAGGFRIAGTSVNAIFNDSNVQKYDQLTITFQNKGGDTTAPDNVGVLEDSFKIADQVTVSRDITGTPTVVLGKDLTTANMKGTDGKALADALEKISTTSDLFEMAANAAITIKTGNTTGFVTGWNLAIGTDGKLTLANAGGTKTYELAVIKAPTTGATNTSTAKFGVDFANYNYVDNSGLKANSVETSADAKAKEGMFDATGASGGVSKADAFEQSTAILTYADNITLQTGARTKDAVNFNFNYNTDGTADMGDLTPNLNLSARADGLSTANLSLANQVDANKAIDQIDKAINKTSLVRASFGAIQNRLEHKITNLTTTSENLTEAESSIRDTDMASEMMNYTKFNILQQAAQSMLAQANQQPQSILQLLG
ncbi:MAG: hypothetical protein NC299_05320 [Lachnospiraceae bacterium]|nr:hypothetical protein [Ruminococcus sp.]MCM1274769.1 hypothetical protein [Lachnospiraceae bacterium]